MKKKILNKNFHLTIIASQWFFRRTLWLFMTIHIQQFLITLMEINLTTSPSVLRDHFAVIITNCSQNLDLFLGINWYFIFIDVCYWIYQMILSKEIVYLNWINLLSNISSHWVLCVWHLKRKWKRWTGVMTKSSFWMTCCLFINLRKCFQYLTFITIFLFVHHHLENCFYP